MGPSGGGSCFAAWVWATADVLFSSWLRELFFFLSASCSAVINSFPPAAFLRGQTAAVSAGEGGGGGGAVRWWRGREEGYEPEAPRPQTVRLWTNSAIGTRPVYTSASRPCLQLAHIFVLPRLNSSDVYFASLEL